MPIKCPVNENFASKIISSKQTYRFIVLSPGAEEHRLYEKINKFILFCPRLALTLHRFAL